MSVLHTTACCILYRGRKTKNKQLDKIQAMILDFFHEIIILFNIYNFWRTTFSKQIIFIDFLDVRRGIESSVSKNCLYFLWIWVFVYNLISDIDKQAALGPLLRVNKHLTKIEWNIWLESLCNFCVSWRCLSLSVWWRIFLILVKAAPTFHCLGLNLFLEMTVINQTREHRRWKRKQRDENSLISPLKSKEIHSIERAKM